MGGGDVFAKESLRLGKQLAAVLQAAHCALCDLAIAWLVAPLIAQCLVGFQPQGFAPVGVTDGRVPAGPSRLLGRMRLNPGTR